MIKVDIISGFLGAGKTTVIKKLFESAYQGQKIVLIENEFGEIGIDGSFLKESGVNIREINSGCICCSLVGDFSTSMKEVIETYSPERIIIEPSGVGKLSDIVKAVNEVEGIKVNVLATVVDGPKCKVYMKNFGEFFDDQVRTADTIIVSKTDKMQNDVLNQTIELLKQENDHANIITTSIFNLDSKQLLTLLEEKASLKDKLLNELKEEHHEHHHHKGECCCGHEHHEHHHHEGECCCGHEHHEHHHEGECCCGHEHHEHHHEGECCCGHEHHEHHHEGECCCGHEHHEHHHHEGECCCGHEHHEHHHEGECCCGHEHHEHHHEGECCCGHEHHEHHHEGECCCGHEHHEHHHHEGECCCGHEHHEHHHHEGECCCGHEHHEHHHHAEEVFTSFGIETARAYTYLELEYILTELGNVEKYGMVLRSKGIVAAADNAKWYYYDFVSGDFEIRFGQPDYTGRICVIGSKIETAEIEKLFNLRG